MLPVLLRDEIAEQARAVHNPVVAMLDRRIWPSSVGVTDKQRTSSRSTCQPKTVLVLTVDGDRRICTPSLRQTKLYLHRRSLIRPRRAHSPGGPRVIQPRQTYCGFRMLFVGLFVSVCRFTNFVNFQYRVCIPLAKITASQRAGIESTIL